MGQAGKKIDGYEEEMWDERIDGTIYLMSPRPAVRHGEITDNIYVSIRAQLGKGKCRAYSENVDFYYHPDCADESKRKDYIAPDVFIVCNRDLFKRNGYYGPVRFAVEVSSPGTAKRDRTTKMQIYAEAGVSEYWIVNPNGVVEIYYLTDGKYYAEESIILCEDKEDKDYNVDKIITLREFPYVKMTVGDIFE